MKFMRNDRQINYLREVSSAIKSAIVFLPFATMMFLIMLLDPNQLTQDSLIIMQNKSMMSTTLSLNVFLVALMVLYIIIYGVMQISRKRDSIIVILINLCIILLMFGCWGKVIPRYLKTFAINDFCLAILLISVFGMVIYFLIFMILKETGILKEDRPDPKTFAGTLKELKPSECSEQQATMFCRQFNVPIGRKKEVRQSIEYAMLIMYRKVLDSDQRFLTASEPKIIAEVNRPPMLVKGTLTPKNNVKDAAPQEDTDER